MGAYGGMADVLTAALTQNGVEAERLRESYERGSRSAVLVCTHAYKYFSHEKQMRLWKSSVWIHLGTYLTYGELVSSPLSPSLNQHAIYPGMIKDILISNEKARYSRASM